MLDLSGDRRSAQIGDNGQAIFPGVPANFRNQTVFISVESPDYESNTSKPHKLAIPSISKRRETRQTFREHHRRKRQPRHRRSTIHPGPHPEGADNFGHFEFSRYPAKR